MAICHNDIREKTGFRTVFEAMTAFKRHQDPNGAWFCIESVRPMVNGLVSIYYEQAESLGFGSVVQRNDLRQEAYAELVKALQHFTPPPGSEEDHTECARAWNRYANIAIKAPIRDAYARSVNTITKPNWAVKVGARINRAITQLEVEAFMRGDYIHRAEAQRSRSYSAVEIAKRSSVPPSTVKSYLANGFHLHPQQKREQYNDDEVVDVSEITNDATPKTLLRNDEERLIQHVFQILDDTQQLVVAYKFGLDGEQKSLNEVAEILNITKKQVRLLEQKALGTMREYLEESGETA